MPTDLGAVLARKRDARAARQDELSLLLMCYAVTLVNVTLLFASSSLAEAVALTGLY